MSDSSPAKAGLVQLGTHLETLGGIYANFLAKWKGELHGVPLLKFVNAREPSFEFASLTYKLVADFVHPSSYEIPGPLCRVTVDRGGDSDDPDESGLVRLGGQFWFTTAGKVYYRNPDTGLILTPFVLPGDAGGVFFAMVTGAWGASGR